MLRICIIFPVSIFYVIAGNVLSESNIGPTNITRAVQEDDVVILCPSYENIAPIWCINEYTYTVTALPKDFKPAYTNLMIPFIREYMNNSIFQCFVPLDVGLEVVPSPVGVLHVNPGRIMQSKLQTKNLNNDLKSELAIDHWHLHFDLHNFTLSWHYSIK